MGQAYARTTASRCGAGRMCVVAVVAAAAAVFFVGLRVTGTIADWYPFPDLTWPVVSVAGVLCCLALSAPLVVWRR